MVIFQGIGRMHIAQAGFPGAWTRPPSWKRKEPGPPRAEPLVIWGGRGIDLTSCLNLALVEFFLTEVMTFFPPSPKPSLHIPLINFSLLALILLFTLELWV